jgi:uncharacterized protein (DUF427 family)
MQDFSRTALSEGSMKAIWNGQVVAESDDIVTVEGNAYFPGSALKREFVRPSQHTSTCPWKGLASYYSLAVNGEINPDAVWTYTEPKSKGAWRSGKASGSSRDAWPFRPPAIRA